MHWTEDVAVGFCELITLISCDLELRQETGWFQTFSTSSRPLRRTINHSNYRSVLIPLTSLTNLQVNTNRCTIRSLMTVPLLSSRTCTNSSLIMISIKKVEHYSSILCEHHLFRRTGDATSGKVSQTRTASDLLDRAEQISTHHDHRLAFPAKWF